MIFYALSKVPRGVVKRTALIYEGELAEIVRGPYRTLRVSRLASKLPSARRISMEFDGFGSLKPIDVIAKTNPILILDEPQKMEGRVTQTMLPKFNAKPGYEKVVFANGETLGIGDMFGGIETAACRRVQIREAIKAHLQKEMTLFPKGIKALTLFFIDAVANYRDYVAANGDTRGTHAKMFEEEYERCVEEALYENGTVIDPELKAYWESIKAVDTHCGYFAQDKKGRIVDKVPESDAGKKDKAESAAYDLIMRGKEKLLSFDDPEGGKVRFIFSHSALREGWGSTSLIAHLRFRR